MSTPSYRKLNFPKIDWSEKAEIEENRTPVLDDKIRRQLKVDLDAITNRKPVNPHIIQSGLRSINFHKDHPDIYKIIDDLCLDCDLKGRELTSEQILKYIVDNLADNKSRKGLNIVFDSIKDTRKNVITSKELAKLAEETGEPMSDKDFQFILQTISEPSDNININQDEFYYIMTKKPAEALKINMATKKTANK